MADRAGQPLRVKGGSRGRTAAEITLVGGPGDGKVGRYAFPLPIDIQHEGELYTLGYDSERRRWVARYPGELG